METSVNKNRKSLHKTKAVYHIELGEDSGSTAFFCRNIYMYLFVSVSSYLPHFTGKSGSWPEQL